MKFKFLVLLMLLPFFVSSCSDDEPDAPIDSVEADNAVFMSRDWLKYFDVNTSWSYGNDQLEPNGESSVDWSKHIKYVKWYDTADYPRNFNTFVSFNVYVSLKKGINLSEIDPNIDLDFSYIISAQVCGLKDNRPVSSFYDIKEERRDIKIKGSEFRDFVNSLNRKFFEYYYSWDEIGVRLCDINSIK